MENTVNNDINQLERINEISEKLIQESYLAGVCRSVWILGYDDNDDEIN